VFAWIIDSKNKDNIFYILRHDFGGSKHTLKRKARAKGKKWRTGIRGQRSGIGGQQSEGHSIFVKRKFLTIVILPLKIAI